MSIYQTVSDVYVCLLTEKLLVFGGLSPAELNSPEVFDLEDRAASCTWPTGLSYPFTAHGMTGGILTESRLLVCGGARYGGVILDKCFALGTSNEVDLITERKFAASILIDNDTLWVTGGDTDGATVKTSEYVTLEGALPGPELISNNEGIDRHCLLKLSQSTAIVVGGRNNVYKPRMFSFETVTWTTLANLNDGRSDHSCGIIYDKEIGSRILVTTGGYNWFTSKTYASTELLALDGDIALNLWTFGPDLPEELQRSASVTTSDGFGFILIGGGGYWGTGFYSKFIYKLECFSFTCEWSVMEQELKTPRTYAFATMVPSSLVDCM